MNTRRPRPGVALLVAIIIALGIAAAGAVAGGGFLKSRLDDRFVTVKGVSVREVQADFALVGVALCRDGNELPVCSTTLTKTDETAGRVV